MRAGSIGDWCGYMELSGPKDQGDCNDDNDSHKKVLNILKRIYTDIKFAKDNKCLPTHIIIPFDRVNFTNDEAHTFVQMMKVRKLIKHISIQSDEIHIVC